MIRILLIVCGVLALLLTGAGVLLKKAWEDNAALTVKYEAQQAETAKANATIADLKIQHAVQNEKMTALQKENQNANTELKRRSRDIRATSERLRQALEREPERAACAVAILDARSMRDVCRASGGSAADCKIAVPESCKAGSGNPADAAAPAGDVVEDEGSPGGRPDVHPKSRLVGN